jgi:hypothetical protein
MGHNRSLALEKTVELVASKRMQLLRCTGVIDGRAELRRGQFVAELDYGRSIAQKSLRPDPVA